MQKIDFERETQYGTYRDAITLFDGQTLTQEEIDQIIETRVNNWLAIIEAMSKPVDGEPPVQPMEPV